MYGQFIFKKKQTNNLIFIRWHNYNIMSGIRRRVIIFSCYIESNEVYQFRRACRHLAKVDEFIFTANVYTKRLIEKSDFVGNRT